VSTATDSLWTDEDVTRTASAIHHLGCWDLMDQQECTHPRHDGDADHFEAHAVLDVLAPRVAEMQRAAKVEALRWAADSFANQGEADAADHVTALAFQIRRGEA
jgi:hypothetical protein